jgi:hypothetical protein
MQSISIKLDIQCEICENSEYLQHDSGFYVCCFCGTMTGVRHGVYLDYEDTKMNKYKIKRKGVDEEDIDDAADYQNFDTTMNTVVNTCANSEFGDSTGTMKSRNKNDKIQKKSLNEILFDHQKIFVKLLKSIYSIQIQKTMKYFPENIKCDVDYSKFFEDLIETSKRIWREFVLVEYRNQIEKKPNFSKSTTKIRSRRNTDDNPNERKLSFNQRHKKNSIKEELKSRKIKQYNIVNIDDNQSKNLKSKDKLKKFIEEYDQVVASLMMDENLFEKEGIELNSNISFKSLLKIASILKINVEDNSTFEQVIHQIFVFRNLNLLSLYKEQTFDESKSTLTSDNFLTLIYSIINLNNHTYTQLKNSNPNFTFPILLYRDISEIFKNFSLNNLFNNEIKLLKYLNRERLLKLLDSRRKNGPMQIETLFFHICQNILHLPNFFSKFCIQIFYLVEKQIQKIKNHVYNIENFSLGVIVYCLKLFYGLNDLPYLSLMSQNKENSNFSNEFETTLELFDNIARRDYLFPVFSLMPSLLKIVENLKNILKQEENVSNLWEHIDLKKPLSGNYKENFVIYNLNYFSKVENNYTINHINLLEKEIKKMKTNEPYTRVEQDKFQNEKCNLKINFSQKFLNKRKMKNPSGKEVRKFLNEEIEFYNSLNNKKKLKSCEVPFPCDTYLRFIKKAMKFDGITPPLSELVIMYYFSKYFKVDYKVLKKCVKIVEGATEIKFK